MSLSDAGSIQEFPVFSYSIRNLAYFDEFIGRMRAGGFARTQFERREVHQSLAAQGRTSGCALFLCRHISFIQHSIFNIKHSPLNYPNTTLAGTPRLWYMFLATSKLIARRPWRISLNAVVDTPIAFAASFCL